MEVNKKACREISVSLHNWKHFVMEINFHKFNMPTPIMQFIFAKRTIKNVKKKGDRE